jgi:hypothetical protein
MTSHDFTRYLPPFANDKLGVRPPLTFRNVSTRIFPLRANLDTLQRLCDNFLNNVVPHEAGYFRAPFPYVNLVVLDYGQMGEEEMRTGWFSQVEAYFGLPVEWYKRVGGQLVFQDWAVITPYIFVSDDVSVPVGRTVYGFPKVLATVELTNSRWLKNPISPTTLARVSTRVFPKAYKGGKLEERVFLEIEQAALSNWRIPIDPTCPNLPWMIASSLAESLGGWGRDALWLAQSMRICPGVPFTQPGFFQDMVSKLEPAFAPGGTGFIVNAVNLKQFRSEDDPSKICYRALTTVRTQTTGFNGAGLLGENHIFLGDLTGGHSIRLHAHASLPIAQVLGLEVQRSWSDQGIEVAELKPVLPFWISLNLKYDQGTNLAWQARDGIWRDGGGASFLGAAPNSTFNNTVTTAIEAISGPFQFTGTTVRVIPLLANRAKLQTYLDDAINDALQGPILREDGGREESEFRFVLWARGTQEASGTQEANGDLASVFLTASSFKNVISSSNNVGDWAKFEVSFMIPVKLQRLRTSKGKGPPTGHAWETIGVGMVPAFTLADNGVTAFSRVEIQGIATGTAQFVRPESVWLSDTAQSHPKQMLLRVKVELLAALGAGQMAKPETVIEISNDDPQYAYGNLPETPWRWAQTLRQELKTKKAAKQQHREELKIARALSLELLGKGVPFSLYTLKQFRDVAGPEKACYQALVRVPRALTELSDLQEIEETLSIRIFGYPDFDVVDTLGLRATRLDEKAAGIVYSTQGLRPFYIRGTVDEALGECLLWRSGVSPWTMRPGAFNNMFSGD